MFGCIVISNTIGSFPLSFPSDITFAETNTDTSVKSRFPAKEIVFSKRGLKYVLLFCLSVMGLNFVWLMTVTAAQCSYGSEISAAYWIATSGVTLTALILMLYLVRRICTDLKAISRFRDSTVSSSKADGRQMLWRCLWERSQTMREKIDIINHIPWGSASNLKFHQELFRKVFCWRVTAQEEQYLSRQNVKCPICAEKIATQEVALFFPYCHLEIHNERAIRHDEVHTFLRHKIGGMKRQGILEVVCPQPSVNLTEFMRTNHIIWRQSVDFWLI